MWVALGHMGCDEAGESDVGGVVKARKSSPLRAEAKMCKC